MSTTASSRKERERSQHRQEILAVALRLFSERGFHDVSMQEIAAAAEFATGTIYNFFDSKEALYREIMNDVGERVLAVMTPILSGPEDEGTKITGFIRAGIRVSRENSAAIRLFLRANPGPLAGISTTHFSETATRVHETIQTMLRDVLASGVRKGAFRDVDPRVTALTLEAALRAMLFAVAQDAREDDIERIIANLEELFLRGILNG